jgi:hypothetical protein
MTLTKNVTAFILAIVALAVSAGCTSLSRSQYTQYIYILPKSEQKPVLVEIDGKIKGEAPGYFEVSRGRSPSITLIEGGRRRDVQIETRYRWSRSFFSGFGFFAYAPIAWVVDIVTGTAWDAEDFKEAGSKIPNAERFRVAVAPPKAGSQEVSDIGGEWLASKLSTNADSADFPGYSGNPVLKPYQETLPIFLENDYVFDVHSGDLGQSRNLYRQLDAEILVESRIEKKGDSFTLESTSLNTISGAKKPGPKWTFQEAELSRRIPGFGTKLKNTWWTRLIPNTVGVDLVSERLEVELATTGLAYQLQPVASSDWFSQSLSYISSLNFSSSPDRRREFSSKWELSAVPVLRFSRKHVKAVDLPIPNGVFVESDPEFVRWLISGGYGLQVGYLNGRHYVYLDIIPTFLWSQVSWRQNGSNQTATRTGFSSQTELGYNYNWRTNWFVKLFTRSQFEPTEVWKDALSSRMGSRQYPVSASTIVSGLTIAYQFESYEFAGSRPRR